MSREVSTVSHITAPARPSELRRPARGRRGAPIDDVVSAFVERQRSSRTALFEPRLEMARMLPSGRASLFVRAWDPDAGVKHRAERWQRTDAGWFRTRTTDVGDVRARVMIAGLHEPFERTADTLAALGFQVHATEPTVLHATDVRTGQQAVVRHRGMLEGNWRIPTRSLPASGHGHVELELQLQRRARGRQAQLVWLTRLVSGLAERGRGIWAPATGRYFESAEWRSVAERPAHKSLLPLWMRVRRTNRTWEARGMHHWMLPEVTVHDPTDEGSARLAKTLRSLFRVHRHRQRLDLGPEHVAVVEPEVRVYRYGRRGLTEVEQDRSNAALTLGSDQGWTVEPHGVLLPRTRYGAIRLRKSS